MERGAQRLFLDQHAVCCGCEGFHLIDYTVEGGGTFRAIVPAIGPGDLQPMTAGDGEMRIAEKRADAADRTPRDDRDAPVERIAQPVDQRGEAAIHRDGIGMRLQFDERPVEVEKQCGVAQQVGGGRGQVGHAQACRGSGGEGQGGG